MQVPVSPYEVIDGIVYFARMCDKVRLRAAGELSDDYVPNLGRGFDALCCEFLGVDYATIVRLAEQGSTAEAILAECLQGGRALRSVDKLLWNGFMTKRAWRDEASERLALRLSEAGLGDRNDIETMFDFIEVDEGRPPQGPWRQ